MTAETVGIWQDIITDNLKKHGISFILLAFAIWYMEGKNQALESKIDTCNREALEMYKTQNALLVQVVQDNSTVLLKVRENQEKVILTADKLFNYINPRQR